MPTCALSNLPSSHTALVPPFLPLAWTRAPRARRGPGVPATGAVSCASPTPPRSPGVTPEGLVSEPKSQVAQEGEVLGPEQRDGRVRPLRGHGEALHPSARVHHQLGQERPGGILRPVAPGHAQEVHGGEPQGRGPGEASGGRLAGTASHGGAPGQGRHFPGEPRGARQPGRRSGGRGHRPLQDSQAGEGERGAEAGPRRRPPRRAGGRAPLSLDCPWGAREDENIY